MKEIRAIGLISFHKSIIIKLCIQRFLLLQLKTPCYASYALSHFNLVSRLLAFHYIVFHDDKKDEKKIIGNACSCVTLPLKIAFCQGKHNKNE